MTHLELTPDYASMFRNMLKEARVQGYARAMFTPSADDRRAELLREVQRWFAPLTIAANCATTVDAINELRTVMTDMLSAIDQEAARLERSVEDADDKRTGTDVCDICGRSGVEVERTDEHGNTVCAECEED